MKSGAPRAMLFSAASLVLLVVWSVELPAAEQEVVRQYVEAEDCEGLRRYPYHNEDAKGWFAREANVRVYGAPGRSWCAMINEASVPAQRTMKQVLPQPLPPGKYRVFLRTKGPIRGKAECVVRVRVGGAEAHFAWKGTRKVSCIWRKAREAEIVLEQPAEEVAFTAAEFGDAQGFGTLYEMIAKGICIDTLYITSNLRETKPPPLQVEATIRNGTEPAKWPVRRNYRADEHGPGDFRTPEPEAQATASPIPLRSHDGRKNMWPNSSFELGFNDGWAADNMHRGCFHVFGDADLSDREPHHGSHSLRVPGPKPITGVPSGYALDPFSRIYLLEDGGDHVLSLYVRGAGEITAHLKRITRTGGGSLYYQIDTKPVLTAKATGSDAWQRISAKGNLKPGEYALYLLSGQEFQVDAIQLEPGQEMTEYAPRAEVEVGLRTAQIGNIVYREEQDWLEAWIHNSGTEARDVSLRYEIRDVRERLVADGTTEPIRADAGTTVRRKLPVLPELFGLFSVRYALSGRELPEGETVVLVIPKPAVGKTRHELGANMNPTEGTLAVNSRLGLKWILTCKSFLFGSAKRSPYPGHPKGVQPEPGVWNWADKEADLIHKHGLKNLPGLWARRAADWMTQPVAPPRTALVKARTIIPKPDLWSDHVAGVVGHYRNRIQRWCIDDEVELEWHPSHLLPVIRATREAARRVAPEVEIGISAVPEIQEEFLALLGDDVFDHFGCSSFDFSYWHSRYVRHVKSRHGKPWVCYGVGGRYPPRTMYHSLPNYAAVYPKAATMARRMVMLLLVQDVDVAGVYTSVIRNDVGRGTAEHLSLDKSLLDYDGTPLPWGASFAIVGRHLADAVPLGEEKLGETGRYAHLFRIGDRVGAVTWATCVRQYDHWWRPPVRRLEKVRFACPEGSVEILDMYWNPHSGVEWDQGGATLDITEEPVFLMDRGLGEKGLRSALRSATCRPEPLSLDLGFATNARGQIDLRVSVTNNTPEAISEALLDFRFPGDRFPFVASGAGLLKRPVAKLRPLAPSKVATVYLPTTLDGSVPYEGGVLRANLSAPGGLEWAADESLSLLPAHRSTRAPTLDGKLEEWESRPAAWLAYDWGWALLSRGTSQLYEGGEHFGYPPYRLDARAAFWASWDDDNLYLAIRLEDDQPVLSGETRESLRVVIAAGESESVLDIQPGKRRVDAVLRARAGQEATKLQAKSRVTRVERLNGALAERQTFRDVGIEIRVPWSQAGIRPKANSTLGFDLFWTDADREGDAIVQGTLRWAGHAKRHGFLLLRGE